MIDTIFQNFLLSFLDKYLKINPFSSSISGLSPFLGDNDAETLANVTAGEYDYDDEAFEEISDHATDFMSKLLVKRKE